MSIKLSRNMTLPDDAVTWKMGLIGRTGKGKTNTAIVMAEQMIEAGSPVVILDPQGDWWGLRSKYEIAILGGDHGDIPLDPRAGETVADFVVAHRHPVLIDLFGMGEAEMVRFATDFARRLWKANREALHIFLDEADLFAPQSGAKGPKAQCLGAWQNVVRRGRSRGLGCTMITQRAAVLNKDLLTQADPLFVHGLSASRDLAAVDEYLDYYGIDRKERRGITAQISKLQVGECFVLSPGTLEIDPLKIAVSKRKSFDSSATPVAGKTRSGPRSLAKVDLSALEKQMATTIEDAKANDPKLLKDEIRELKKQLDKKTPVVDGKAIDRAVQSARKEVNKHWESQLKKLETSHGKLAGRLIAIAKLSQTNGEAAVEVFRPLAAKTYSVERLSRPRPAGKAELANDARIGGGALRMVQVLADRSPARFTESQWATLAKLKKSGGTWSTYKSRLLQAGLVARDGNYWVATEDGIEQFGDPRRAPQSAEEIREQWKGRLGSGPSRMIEALIEAPMTRGELAEATGLTATAGTFGTYLSRLRSNGLIENEGEYLHLVETLVD